MEETLRALGGLMLKAVPTFVLLLVLHFYLKRVFFGPLDRVLQARWQASEGARKRAEESLENAARKANEYQEAIRNARGEIYQEQDSYRKQVRHEQAAAVEETRRAAEAAVGKGKAELAMEAAEAGKKLEAESGFLAEQIASAVLERRAS